MCRKPYVTSDGKAYGCGQCLPCRINRKRQWTHRLILEAAQYKDNAFVTLTYNDENLRFSESGLPTLDPNDLRLWMMRLRSRLARMDGPFPKGVRFYAVGEYGDETQRPHYHVMLFGYPACHYGQSQFSKLRGTCCVACNVVRDTWGLGNVYVGTVEKDSAGYVAGYVVKKMTKKDDERLGDRYPEFSRQSLRPGIGYDALYEIADCMLRYFADAVDVPKELRHGMAKLPLDRYLRKKLRLMVGRDESAPQEVLQEMVLELSDLYARAKDVTSAPGMRAAFRYVFADLIEADGANKAAHQAARLKIRPRRKVL